MLYGHKHPVPAPGVPGECYTVPGAAYVEDVHREAVETAVRRPSIMQEEEEEDTGVGEEIVITYTRTWGISIFHISEKVELLGKGACRGKGWQDGQWPLAKGRQTLGKCADLCKKTAGCVAFDLSNKDGDAYDCLLLGHPGVLPASGLAAKCYIIRGAKPLPATLVSAEARPGQKAADTSYPPSGE